MQDSAITCSRRVAAEGVGTALLVATVVGSGIMAERLGQGNQALILLCNTLATGAGLLAFILMFTPVSGAHFNPLVSLVAWRRRQLGGRVLAAYWGAQSLGGVLGTMGAHFMFGVSLISHSSHARNSPGELFSEVVATFGLVGVIVSVSRSRPAATPFVVASYITAAYWFTASTSFANPAVTWARALTDSFSGIRVTDVPQFLLAQCAGAFLAWLFFSWLYPDLRSRT